MKPAKVDDIVGRLWDLEKCRKWVAAHRPFLYKGGKRAGAGRPPKWKLTGGEQNPGKDFSHTGLAKSAAAAPEEPPERPEPPPPPPTPEMQAAWGAFHLGMATAEQMALVCGVSIGRSATPAEGKHLAEMAEALERNRKASVARGVLVEVDEVRTLAADWLAGIRVQVSALIVKVSARVMSVGQVAGEKEPLVRAAVAAEVESLVSSLREMGVANGKEEQRAA